MSTLRCLFKMDPHGSIVAEREPEVFLADEETVSSVSAVATGARVRIGWATPPRDEYERRVLSEHPDCVWVTTICKPMLVADVDERSRFYRDLRNIGETP